MKKLNLLLLSAVCSLLFIVNAAIAQTTPAGEFKKFGAGVSFQPFGIANILEELEGVPITKINLAINITKGFRFEIDLGYYSRNNKSAENKFNSFNGGIGILGTKRIDANVIMGGIKADYNLGKSTFENNNGSEVESKFNRIAGGPVLGYEHIFGGRFGVGGELGLKFSSFTIEPEDPSDDKIESTSVYTDSAIFVRMYF